MEHIHNKTIDLNARVINDKNNSSQTYKMPEKGTLSKFSIKKSKKPAPSIPHGFALWC